VGPQDMAIILNAFARLDVPPPDLFLKALHDVALSQLPSFNPQVRPTR
jgi:hypothetical protein